MKIEIEVDNFKDFINGLQNALVAYKDVRDGMEEQSKIIKSFHKAVIIFDIRLKELENVYKQLEKKEKELND